jgi:hypothetical protein
MNTPQMPKRLQILTMLEVLISKYYEYEATGGSMHCELDDGNYDFIANVEKIAESGDYFCSIIGMLWNQLTEEDRKLLREEWWRIYEETDGSDKRYTMVNIDKLLNS